MSFHTKQYLFFYILVSPNANLYHHDQKSGADHRIHY